MKMGLGVSFPVQWKLGVRDVGWLGVFREFTESPLGIGVSVLFD